MLSPKKELPRQLEAEDALGSMTRLKIVRLLMQMGQLNVSNIAERMKISYVVTFKHLEILERAGIVVHRKFGRIRQYRIDECSIRAAAVRALIEAWGPEMSKA